MHKIPKIKGEYKITIARVRAVPFDRDIYQTDFIYKILGSSDSQAVWSRGEIIDFPQIHTLVCDGYNVEIIHVL